MAPSAPDSQTSQATPRPRQRVAIVYPFFPHYRKAVMNELLMHGRHEYVLIGDVEPLHETVKPWVPPAGVPFIRIRNHHLRGPWFWQSGLVRLAVRGDFDTWIIHLNAYHLGSVFSSLVARLSGKRVLNWNHGWTKRDRGFKRWVRRLVYRIPHEFLLYGNIAKMIGMEEGCRPEQLHVIYNSLDVDQQRPLRIAGSRAEIHQIREGTGLVPELPVVVCSTRLVHERRLDLLIEAAALLGTQGHHVQVLLIGEGPERQKLGELAERQGVRLHLYGACYDEAVLARLVGCANVTVAPERLGLTAMHSLTYGTPAVTHDQWEDQMPEAEAIVPGRTGSFYRRGDVGDLAEHIRGWTATPLPDPAVRAACHATIDRFWNPQFQRRAIERAIDGAPADDLFFLRDTNQHADEPARS